MATQKELTATSKELASAIKSVDFDSLSQERQDALLDAVKDALTVVASIPPAHVPGDPTPVAPAHEQLPVETSADKAEAEAEKPKVTAASTAKTTRGMTRSK